MAMFVVNSYLNSKIHNYISDIHTSLPVMDTKQIQMHSSVKSCDVFKCIQITIR